MKCISCADYDLCEKCEQINSVHIDGHFFIKIKTLISKQLATNYVSNASNAFYSKLAKEHKEFLEEWKQISLKNHAVLNSFAEKLKEDKKSVEEKKDD